MTVKTFEDTETRVIMSDSRIDGLISILSEGVPYPTTVVELLWEDLEFYVAEHTCPSTGLYFGKPLYRVWYDTLKQETKNIK